MKEKQKIILVCIFLILIWMASAYFVLVKQKFNFSGSDIKLIGNNIDEILMFYTDDSYHTLFRNFETPVGIMNTGAYILINGVECPYGKGYYEDYYGKLNTFLQPTFSSLYIEKNEYGCSFGSQRGFVKGGKYWIRGNYFLQPDTLIRIRGETYIKFVVYSANKHNLLIKGININITGSKVVAPNVVLANSPFIIFIPYPPSGKEVILEQRGFDFENSKSFFSIFLFLLPAIVVYLIWHFYGQETIEGDYPNEMSMYPKERKAWEIHSFFNPPFSSINENFIPTMLMDFYNRKLIDIKTEKKDTKIKIISKGEGLDEIESVFMDFLEAVRDESDEEGAYFSLKKSFISGFKINKSVILFEKIKETIIKKSKDYIEHGAFSMIALLFVVVLFMMVYNVIPWIMLVPGIITAILLIFTSTKTALFIRYKKGYYDEYQQWQSFKRYLSNSYSMKNSPPKGIVLWDHYLVYATALGVGEKILKVLETEGYIKKDQVTNYSGIYLTSSYFSTYSPSSSGGGAGGGGFSGGGGMGGGGGGGR